MSMIFPGMDPYLESAELWSSVHSRLIVHIADSLQPLLRPRYNASGHCLKLSEQRSEQRRTVPPIAAPNFRRWQGYGPQ